MPIALFDLDKTLLARNSAALWLTWELRRGNVRPDQAAIATAWLVRYGLGFGGLEEPMRRSFLALGGVPAAPWGARVVAFYKLRLRHLYRAKGLQALRAHRAAGDVVVPLSSTHHVLANAVQADLHFDHLLCNRLAIDAQGLFTGRLDGPLCFGTGKLTAAADLCARLGEPLSSCVFYTDSASDLPVLQAVGHPVAVNADPTLRRIARKNLWPQVDWGPAAPWPNAGPSGPQPLGRGGGSRP